MTSASKRAAEELCATRAMWRTGKPGQEQYLSRMSHELRTPLTTMLEVQRSPRIRDPRDDQTQAINAIQKAGGLC